VQDRLLFLTSECLFLYAINLSINQCSKILSLCVSYFTSVYVMKWKDFFPSKELKEPRYFDARAVCYPDMKTIGDYLAWRQVDCKLLELQFELSCITNATSCFILFKFFALISYKEIVVYIIFMNKLVQTMKLKQHKIK
jgi:hypothetical protein